MARLYIVKEGKIIRDGSGSRVGEAGVLRAQSRERGIRQTTIKDLLGRRLNNVEVRNAPPLIYCKGVMETPLVGPKISIVGSRDAAEDGLQEAAEIAEKAVKSGIVVVSGLARGIDTAAHRAAIKHSGKTVGVIGTPLDKAYPRENALLQQQMMEEQLVISQFPVGQNTRPGNFVQRNKTMALISDATVIVRASDRSGSLHQGWEAIRLGRPLFISKTIISNSKLKQPQDMLGYGAIVMDSFESILEHLPLNMKMGELLSV